jgi:hydrogenase maturation protease
VIDRPVLVIGYGNSLRRDDGAGLILAQSLVHAWQTENLPVSLITDHQLNPEIADDIVRSGAQLVLFADAAAGAPGASIEALPIPVPSLHEGISPSLGHHVTPEVVLLYARELFGFRGHGWLLSIPGTDFDHGEGLSDATRTLVADFVRTQSNDLWQRIHAAAGTTE